MSVLRDRITAQPGLGGPQMHPYGTSDTPMVMPMSEISYEGEHVLYGTVHPLITADGAVIAARTEAMERHPVPAPVHPAGRY